MQPGAVILFCILGGKEGKENIRYCWETAPNGAIITDIRGQLGTILTLLVASRTLKLIIDMETNIQMTVKWSNPHVARVNIVHELKKHWVGCFLGQNFFLVAGKKNELWLYIAIQMNLTMLKNKRGYTWKKVSCIVPLV